MKTADDLKDYNKTEERKMEEIIASIHAAGINVVVSGGTVSDMALHFLEKYKIMCVKLGSKWDLRRLCLAVGATALVRLGPPTPEEIGSAPMVRTIELGERTLTVFERAANAEQSEIATIILRASTISVLNDLERAVDDGVHAASNAGKDGRCVWGGGAVEMDLSLAISKIANQTPGLEQYALEAFAQALLVVPRTLAENAGWETTRVVADLQAAHAAGTVDAGIDLEDKLGVTSMKETAVIDLLSTKLSALKLAVDATITILKIDQIIMSKPSGGPSQK
jgi:T-complex protein 1 subunit theta